MFNVISDATEEAHYNIAMKSVGAIRDFYTFGIYGRDFNLDSAAGILPVSFVIVIAAALITTVKTML